MTRPTDPSRPAPPTVREIAELTARLRKITARGRDVDPDERAQFLADKNALIFRITDATDDDVVSDDTANPETWDQPLPVDRPADPLSCFGRGPAGPALDRGPGRVDEQERRAQLARWHAEDHSVDTEGAERVVCCVDPALGPR